MNCKTSYVRKRELPETVNIHLTRSCNFGCRFCYTKIAECGSTRIPPDQLRRILEAIRNIDPLPDGRRRKVNFAGGKPPLYPWLPDIIEFCKRLGLVTSFVANGSLLDERTIVRLSGSLDICAVSMDSGAAESNDAIGRCAKKIRPDAHFYLMLVQTNRSDGYSFQSQHGCQSTESVRESGRFGCPDAALSLETFSGKRSHRPERENVLRLGNQKDRVRGLRCAQSSTCAVNRNCRSRDSQRHEWFLRYDCAERMFFRQRKRPASLRQAGFGGWNRRGVTRRGIRRRQICEAWRSI